jgi:hypothetical protein
MMGPLALLTSLARGGLHAQQAETILLTGWINLVAFAALGYAVGWIAERIVAEAVRMQVAAELPREEGTERSERVVSAI